MDNLAVLNRANERQPSKGKLYKSLEMLPNSGSDSSPRKRQEHHQQNPLKTNKSECTSQSLPPSSAADHTELYVQHDPSTLCFTAEYFYYQN